jgi:hypothetical protein
MNNPFQYTSENTGSYHCADCDYREDPSGQGYCYMFKEKPPFEDGCAQHSKAPKLRGSAAHLLILLECMNRTNEE